MVQIKRSACSVIVYDEEQGKGIAFPANPAVEIEQFVKELQQITCSNEIIKPGVVITPMVFDPQFESNYRPMSEFLEDKVGTQILDDDQQAEELYRFYYTHAMLVLSPGGVSFMYMGKAYFGMDVTIGLE